MRLAHGSSRPGAAGIRPALLSQVRALRERSVAMRAVRGRRLRDAGAQAAAWLGPDAGAGMYRSALGGAVRTTLGFPAVGGPPLVTRVPFRLSIIGAGPAGRAAAERLPDARVDARPSPPSGTPRTACCGSSPPTARTICRVLRLLLAPTRSCCWFRSVARFAMVCRSSMPTGRPRNQCLRLVRILGAAWPEAAAARPALPRRSPSRGSHRARQDDTVARGITH